MNKSIFELFRDMFGNTLAGEIADFMESVLESLNTLVSGQAGVWLSIFTVVAASLLIIYFFMNMASDVSREMFTLEKLVLYFIRFFLAFLILLYLKEIIIGVMNFCYVTYKYVSQSLTNGAVEGATFFGVSLDKASTLEYSGDIQTQMEAAFSTKLSKILESLMWIVMALILKAASMLMRVAAYFVCVSTSVTMIVRIIYSPLAVVQCFDPLQHNKGIDYIKKIIATGLTFSIIVVILYATSLLQNTLMTQIVRDLQPNNSGGALNIDADSLRLILETGLGALGKLLVCNFACIGGMMSASKIANDIVGTH